MIDEEQARTICYNEINRPDPNWSDKPEFVVVHIDQRPSSWVVYYQSRLFVDTGQIGHALAGNGPYVISKSTGDFEATGTVPPLEKRIDEAEQRLLARGVF